MARGRRLSKKVRKKIAKKNRKNLRLWAEGARESILKPHLEPYADALDRNWRSERDYLQSVCNEFHARISWRLEDHEEPELPLPEYDPKKVVVEEELDDAEEAQKSARIVLLDKRIRRWLKYRVRRLRKQLHSRLDAHTDPWSVLVGKLAGLTAPPKARQAYQQFMHEEYAERIAPVVAERWAAATGAGSNVQTKKTPDAAFRAAVARDLFGELSEAERVAYGSRAKEEAAERRAEYKAALQKDPSRAPEDRQKCIDNIGDFLSPILLGIQNHTGLHSTVLLGGPIPKYGEMRAIYVAYGRNRAADPLHFPAWSGPRFDSVLALMKEYLGTAFTAEDVEECRLANTLAGAKYTIAPKSDSDNSTSDSSDSEDTSDDSNADSDDTVPAKKQGAKKKSKAAPDDSNVDSDDSVPAKKKRAKKKSKAAADASNVDSDDSAAAKKKPGDKKKQHAKKAVPAAKGKRHADQSKSTAKRKSRPAPSDSDSDAEQPLSDKSRPKKRSRRPLIAPHQPTAMDVDPPGTTPSASAQRKTSSAVPPTPPTTQLGMASASGAHGPESPVADDTPLLPVEFPSNAPGWLIDAIAWLMQVELGSHYRALVVALISLEARYDFVGGSAALPKAKRPTPVNLWIQGARGARLKFPPTISNRELYAEKWNEWWDSLQPGWRVRGEDGYWTVGGEWGPDDEWGLLEAPGPNGCLGLVAGLYFWGVYKNDPPELVEKWTRAVQDVTWMLEGLAVSFPVQKKGRSKKV
ncbi:hypothetical protein C8F04DRAFT_1268565 [Mycena alexandri]|uniref:Uncharacterized protein n=1 Tax=Mycena alexandri TaxID=1745969 RepID=A0AAD6WT12_9AGAR|nr:hypothetical protein C8F04DRAFT_1268565 [Mycena alexandri]